MRLAKDVGADGVEFDVRFTSDHRIVLHHDDVVAGLGPLIDHTLYEVRRAVPAIATLGDVIDEVEGMILNVEIKNHPGDADYDPSEHMAVRIAEWITQASLEDRLLVSSFNPMTIERVRALAPTVATGLLLGRVDGLRRQIAPSEDPRYQWLLAHRSAFRIRSNRLIRRTHDAGLLIGAWPVDGVDDLRRLRSAGIDAVITNDPAVAVEAYA